MSLLSDAISRLCNWIRLDRSAVRCKVLTPTELACVQRDIELVLEVFHLPSHQDRRLTYTKTDDIILHMVWCLKPGAPQVVAVCSTPECADTYRGLVTKLGGLFFVEAIVLDHAFGRNDIQTIMYRESSRRSSLTD